MNLLPRARRLRPAALLGVVLTAVVLGACGGSAESGPPVPPYPVGTVADDGFRPADHGLPFANYSNQLTDGTLVSNMTPADVQEMFGDVVCADAQLRRCDLIPEAQAWLNTVNQEMAKGHCYGFSVVASLLWQHQLDPTAYGAPTVPRLQIHDNLALQRQIAYDWALQTLDSVQSGRTSGTPNRILLKLIAALKPDARQAYTIVFWKPDGTGGHAVTPYAVQSRGGGRFDVLIYDNNWPNQTRAISFDTNSNTWSYKASTNPNAPGSLYRGDAGTRTISLDAASSGLGTQSCPFCGKVPRKGVATSGRTNTEEIALVSGRTARAHLVITDSAGHQLGYVNGRFVDQIRASRAEPVVSDQDWTNELEPTFVVPADKRYTISIDGKTLTSPDNETLTIVAPAYDLSVQNITIRPGETDTLIVAPDATHVGYRSSRSERPTIKLGVSDTGADYSFVIAGVDDQPGSTLNITLPPEGSTLGVQSVGSKVQSTIDFRMTRSTEQGVQRFSHNSITLAGGDRAAITFGSWTAATEPIPLSITHDEVESTQELTNQQPT